jgi:UDP-glucuronate decarboxylase
MQSPIVVLGCSGAVGKRIVSIIVESGHEVLGYRGKSPCNLDSKLHKCHSIDLLTDSIHDDLKKIQARTLIHTAWLTRPIDYLENIENQIWLHKSKDVIKSFFEFGGEDLLITGTCAEYNWHDINNLKEESNNEFPESLYGKSKLALLDWLRFSELPFLWTRTFFQYGQMGDSQRLIPYLLESVGKGEKCTVRGANEIRDFVFIDDVAKALVSLVEKGAKGVVNVGSGQGILLADLAELICHVTGKPNSVKLEYADEPKTIVSNQDKFRSLLPDFHFRPIESGLREMMVARVNNNLLQN